MNNNTLHRINTFEVWTRVLSEDVLTSFDYRYLSSIKSFFSTQFIDIPTCFRKSKSTYTQTFELPLLKLNNLLMRCGNRGFMLKTLTESFTRILSLGDASLNIQFKDLPLLFSYTYDNANLTPRGLVDTSLNPFNQTLLKYGNKFDSSGVIFNRKSTVTHYLFEELKKYTPLFNFYVRKVDKNVRKNSRGKSGKYMII